MFQSIEEKKIKHFDKYIDHVEIGEPAILKRRKHLIVTSPVEDVLQGTTGYAIITDNSVYIHSTKDLPEKTGKFDGVGINPVIGCPAYIQSGKDILRTSDVQDVMLGRDTVAIMTKNTMYISC